jgi:hypothetical protein
MLELKRHPLVSSDIRVAVNWYASKELGLEMDFVAAVGDVLDQIEREPLIYAIRFADIRRANTKRFPYGIFT